MPAHASSGSPAGRPRPWQRRRRAHLALALRSFAAVGWLVGAGCAGPSPDGRPGPAATSVRLEFAWSNATGVVEGTLQNTGRAAISSVSVEFQLVDDREEPVQRVTARRQAAIAPGGIWEFRVPANHLQARRVRRGPILVR